jgi:hypothetical protein
MIGALLCAALFFNTSRIRADVHSVDASAVVQPKSAGDFALGSNKSPDGHVITVTRIGIDMDGKPILPVMGEFHYSRYPRAQWRSELLKMKAGGVTIVSTYVFWIHHEEIKGRWDWSGDRDLRAFEQTIKDVGLMAVVRLGPWDHGEVRNGGLPQWLVDESVNPQTRFELRSTNPTFMGYTAELYSQIAKQLSGLYWKNGGPIVGVQFDNEYGGDMSYLMALKKLAIAQGIDVPLYTRTGWAGDATTKNQPPYGEILPLAGSYAEGFWSSGPKTMGDPRDFLAFTFAPSDGFTPDYPYLCCELGGGMMTSYHRRIRMFPDDITAVATNKFASGSNMMGYYMYHGGTNPEPEIKGATLMEIQSSLMTNYNDMPVKTYDFQAPIGEFGQIRPHYNELRRLNMFLADFGSQVVPMQPVATTPAPRDYNDTSTLRWAVRSDGNAGLLFVSNYERRNSMPEQGDVQFSVKVAGGREVTFLDHPVNIPADLVFFWPFNLDLAGATLVSATAQPMCTLDDGNTTYAIFAQTPDIDADFVFDGVTPADLSRLHVDPGIEAPVLTTKSGRKLQIVVLDQPTSLNLYKANWAGRDRLFITKAALTIDGNKLNLASDDPADLAVSIFPAPAALGGDTSNITQSADGIFRKYTFKIPAAVPLKVEFEQTQQAGPPRTISLATAEGSSHNAQEPSDGEFTQAAVWKIHLPPDASDRDLMLRIHYTGDVARLYVGDRFIDDNFYNGTTFDLGVNRFGPDIYTKDLLLKILPLRQDAPIYIHDKDKPPYQNGIALGVQGVEVIEHHQATLTAP